jgi:hypothetical protein
MQAGGAFSRGRESMELNRKVDIRSVPVMPLKTEVQVREEIVLEPELLNSLYRRGGRRLRDIQKSCRVSVWFDKFRGVLQLSGSEACVASAKNLIAGLGGPRVPVSAAVWLELSRTRKLLSGSEAAVANIQRESGCRIHVERTRQEVHLFGNSESVVIAQKLLKELDLNCIEEVIEVTDSVNSMALQALATKCGVSCRCEDNLARILGLRNSVKKAVETINQHLKDSDFCLELPPTPTESVDTQTGHKNPGVAQNPTNNFPKSASNDKVHMACPTCKACPFCPSCGHPTTFVDTAEPSGFATDGAGNNSQAAPFMWRQMPFVPYDGGNGQVMTPALGGPSDNMVPMAFMMPGSQNMQVCFVPAAMMAG